MFAVSWASSAPAQECPRASPNGPNILSKIRTLRGRLIFHDGIGQWFELKLDRRHCGQRGIQLVGTTANNKDLETLRGCRVTSSGALDLSPTGYYSLDVFQKVKTIRPIGLCARQSPFPDNSQIRPDKSIHAYSVEMDVDYRPGDHPIAFHVRSAGRELRPWQAYASYWVTGGLVLYGLCGEGFVVDEVYGTPSAHPNHFDDPRDPNDMASFDPESAAEAGTTNLHLGYTCIRQERGIP